MYSQILKSLCILAFITVSCHKKFNKSDTNLQKKLNKNNPYPDSDEEADDDSTIQTVNDTGKNKSNSITINSNSTENSPISQSQNFDQKNKIIEKEEKEANEKINSNRLLLGLLRPDCKYIITPYTFEEDLQFRVMLNPHPTKFETRPIIDPTDLKKSKKQDNDPLSQTESKDYDDKDNRTNEEKSKMYFSGIFWENGIIKREKNYYPINQENDDESSSLPFLAYKEIRFEDFIREFKRYSKHRLGL